MGNKTWHAHGVREMQSLTPIGLMDWMTILGAQIGSLVKVSSYPISWVVIHIMAKLVVTRFSGEWVVARDVGNYLK